jgi:PIN domain nuclease of toxin-antitoxin system
VELLLDTQLILWAAYAPGRIPFATRTFLEDPDHTLTVSAASVWEIVIKRGLGRPDFRIDPRSLRRGLAENGYGQLPVTAAHTLAVDLLPPIHKDPFDRILLAQALVEAMPFVTADQRLTAYPGDIRLA